MCVYVCVFGFESGGEGKEEEEEKVNQSEV